MKYRKAAAAVILAAAVTISAVPAPAAAAGSGGSPSYGSAAKEEVVYAQADSSGDIRSAQIVNIVGKGNIRDYGDYTSVKALNTTDKINYSGGVVTFNASDERTYYQGDLSGAELPWDISVRYFLDGREYQPSDLAGRSGSLLIKLRVTKNKACEGEYFENYALQALLTLDTKKCSDISVSGATLANSGENKLITYTALPGKGIDSEIRAEVTDFEMPPVTMNGVMMSMDIDVNDEALMERLRALMSGISEVNDGVLALTDGISKYSGGISEYGDKLSSLPDRSRELTSGSAAINEAASAISEGTGRLAEAASQLKAQLGYSQYKSAMSAKGLDIDSLISGNESAAAKLADASAALQQQYDVLVNVPGQETQAAAVKAQIDLIGQVMTIINGDRAAISGFKAYLDAFSAPISDMSTGADQLAAGAAKLKEQYSAFDKGVSSYTGVADKLADSFSALTGGASSLAGGADALKKGSGALASASSGLDSKAREKIDSVISGLQGNGKVVSFASPKNTDVKSVQFVIKTAGIEKVKETPAAEKTVKKSFWQKFISLFDFLK